MLSVLYKIPFVFITPQSLLCCGGRLVFLRENTLCWPLEAGIFSHRKTGPVTDLDLQIWKHRATVTNLLSLKPTSTGMS